MAMDKWNVLEERITQLVDNVKQLRADNTRLQDELQRVEQELGSKGELITQLEQQNEKLRQLEGEHRAFQQERGEISDRLEKMLSELEQIQLESA
jgi:chromosome segregation ATPase